jgi:hypothetical protein
MGKVEESLKVGEGWVSGAESVEGGGGGRSGSVGLPERLVEVWRQKHQQESQYDEQDVLEELSSTQDEGRNARAVFFLQIGFDATELRIDDEAPAIGLSW